MDYKQFYRAYFDQQREADRERFRRRVLWVIAGETALIAFLLAVLFYHLGGF
jgi:hypothetical protein